MSLLDMKIELIGLAGYTIGEVNKMNDEEIRLAYKILVG